MRLFAAVDPPPHELRRLAAAIDRQDVRLRWLPPERWHITLAFYGEVPEARWGELATRLGRAAARTPPIRLQLSGLGTFPARAGHARVLWVGLAGDLEPLSRLADRCRAAGRRIGLRLEDRAFRPHLTLARAREPVDLRELVASSSYDGQRWPVTALRLVHSTLGAQARHETLVDWPVASEGYQP